MVYTASFVLAQNPESKRHKSTPKLRKYSSARKLGFALGHILQDLGILYRISNLV